MKVRNFAFFGVMASILGISAANAASDTVIASQAYVDAVANTKQPTLQNTHITDNQTGQFITDITATNGQITVTRGNAPATDLTDYETSQHASETYQPKINDLDTIRTNARDAQKASDSKVDANGNFIAQGNGVGENLKKLDTGIGNLTETGVEGATSIAKAIKTVKEIADGAAGRDLSAYDDHIGNTTIHVTAADKTTWSGKQNALDENQMKAVNSGATSDKITNYDKHLINDDIHVTAEQKEEWSGKQAALTEDQLKAVNSGITATKVSTYDGYASTIAGKQAALSEDQLKAVNSGATSDKITNYDKHIINDDIHVTAEQKEEWSGKQAALTEDQLKAVNSGITATKVSTYDGYATDIAGKQNKSTADYQMGNSSGTWTAMTQAQQDALNSGATSTNIGQISGKVNIQQDTRDKNKIVMTGEEGKIDTFVSIDPNTMVIDDHGNLAARIPSASNFIEDAITDNVTNKAPSENAVFDALALKANAATTYTKTEVDTALAGKQAAFSDGSTTGSGEAVTSVTQAAGKVDATKSVLHYNKAMEYKLANYTTGKTAEQFNADECSAANPCVLTIVGMQGDEPVYEWTQMAL